MPGPTAILQPAHVRPDDRLMRIRDVGTSIQTAGADSLMGVQKRKDLAPRRRTGVISRSGNSDPLVVTNDAHVIRLDSHARPVGRTIVDDDDLIRLLRVGLHGFDRSAEFFALVVRRDDNGQTWNAGRGTGEGHPGNSG